MNCDVQHEQRGGDGEDAVAEGRQPAGTQEPAPTWGICVIWHGTISFASLGGGSP
jgi:hypothetical protein